MSSQVQDISSPVSLNLVAEMERTHIPVAELARQVGTSEKQIRRWRAGMEPRYRSVKALAEAFGRDTEWFYVEHEEVPA